MTVYGYARVSTAGQDLHEQINELINSGVSKDTIFSEKFTGTTTNRPEFNKLMELVNPGDMIVVTKLDRFARNTREALDAIEPLLNKDVAIRVINLGMIENTPMGRMIMRTLLSVAEMERDMIVERTQAGKEYAKLHNPRYKEGRPKKYKPEQLDLAMELLETNSYTRVAKMTGISKSTLIREHNRRLK